jgi:ribosomal protein L37AE/L43A
MGISGESLKERRLQLGLCGRCGKHPLATGTLCEICRQYTSEKHKLGYARGTNRKRKNSRKIRSNRRSKGLCERCGKNNDSGEKIFTCTKCRTKSAKIRQEIKKTVFEAYGGSYCNCCGETLIQFLTLDHIDGDGANHRKTEFNRKNVGGDALYRWAIKHNFPPIFQVLCYNCNCGRQHNNGVCPHSNPASTALVLPLDK